MTGRTATIRAGIYRRRVLVRAEQHCVTADIEDDPHRFGVDVHHDGARVIDVSGRALRVPWITCPQATAELTRLVQTPLLTSPFDVLRQIDTRQQCTHLLDMAALAIAAAARDITNRQFDVALRLTEGDDNKRYGHLCVDMGPQDQWVVDHGIVIKPTRYSGIDLTRSFKGFSRQLTDDELLELFVMRRAHLVCGGRRFDLDTLPLPTDYPWLANACFTFQSARVAGTRRVMGSTRDFTRREADLLADLGAAVKR
jgi:hypothetical protein